MAGPCRVGSLQLSLDLYSLLLAWGITEAIRYPFYALKELADAPYALTWLRYTTFIVLYPLGVSSELAMVWLALPQLRSTGLWSAPMPNMMNFDCQYYAFCIIAMLAYAPGAAHPAHALNVQVQVLHGSMSHAAGRVAQC